MFTLVRDQANAVIDVGMFGPKPLISIGYDDAYQRVKEELIIEQRRRD